ncbi:hypothetical protein D9M70_501550 [compost metagenome]
MQGGRVLDLVGIDVEARDQDHVFLAVDQEHVAVLVDIADVARAQETVRVQDQRGFVGALPVALRDLRAAHADLAGFSNAQFPAVVVADRNVGGRHGQADRPGEDLHVQRVDRDRGRGLGKPVGLRQRAAGYGLPAVGHRALHRHAAAHCEAQPGKIQAREVRMVEQGVKERVDAGEGRKRHLAHFFDQPGDVARIDDEQVAGAHFHEDQAVRREREDVIKR